MKLENLVYGLVDIELEINEHNSSQDVKDRLIGDGLSLCIDNGYPEVVDLSTKPELMQEITNQIRTKVTQSPQHFLNEEFKMLADDKSVIEYNLYVDVRGHESVMYSISEISSGDYFIKREM